MEGFDEVLHQVQNAHPGLDLSFVKIEDPVQASVVPVASENTDELFVGDATIGDGEFAQARNVQVQSIVDEAHQPVVEEAHQLVNIVEQTKDNSAPQ